MNALDVALQIITINNTYQAGYQSHHWSLLRQAGALGEERTIFIGGIAVTNRVNMMSQIKQFQGLTPHQ